jgi:hypothetical protein
MSLLADDEHQDARHPDTDEQHEANANLTDPEMMSRLRTS